MKKAFFVIGMIGSVIVTFNSCAVGSFKTFILFQTLLQS